MSEPEGTGTCIAVMEGAELYRFPGRDYWQLRHSRWPGDVGGGRATWSRVTGERPFDSDAQAAACWQDQHKGRPIRFL